MCFLKKSYIFTAVILLTLIVFTISIISCSSYNKAPNMFSKRFVQAPSMMLLESPVQHNTEEYDRIYENEFLSVMQNPLSTFSIDVDTASYSNMRRFLNQGNMPPKDAVRIEELINYFSYDYPQPDGENPVSVVSEVSECPWNSKNRLVHIGLKGKNINKNNLPPSNLVFLLDVSGSMADQNKLPLLQAAFKLLVNQMNENDRISIVVYAGAAGLVLPPTMGSDKNVIIEAINNLYAGGSTAGGQGIKLAYKIAEENLIKNGNNRIILATDGDFNVGVSSTGDLVRMIEKKREKGVFLTVLGFGMGNYKDSRMENLADKGNGNYAYIDSLMEAKKVLVTEIGGTLFTIAKDVKIQVEFNPTNVSAYRLIGYENRLLKKEDFNNDKKDAGEIGSGHTVTALYEVIPKGVESNLPKVDSLRYQTVKLEDSYKHNSEIMTVKIRYKRPKDNNSKLMVKTVFDKMVSLEQSSDDFRFSAAVAQFGMLLRNSKFKAKSSFENVLTLSESAMGYDTNGYRREFAMLVKKGKQLDKTIQSIE